VESLNDHELVYATVQRKSRSDQLQQQRSFEVGRDSWPTYWCDFLIALFYNSVLGILCSEKERKKGVTEGQNSPARATITRTKTEPGKIKVIKGYELKTSSLKGCNGDNYNP